MEQGSNSTGVTNSRIISGAKHGGAWAMQVDEETRQDEGVKPGLETSRTSGSSSSGPERVLNWSNSNEDEQGRGHTET